ncbi:MAG: Hsp20/alpha crystallin family protein [Pseudomonadota bacterium]
MKFKSEALGDLSSLQERMNRLFNESLKRIKEIADPEAEKSWSPAADVWELDDRFMLLADLPGVAREAVQVEIQGGSLVISGRRSWPDDLQPGRLFHSERHSGEFQRTFSLPVNVTDGKIEAKLRDGVLCVVIGKPEGQVRRVKVDIE